MNVKRLTQIMLMFLIILFSLSPFAPVKAQTVKSIQIDPWITCNQNFVTVSEYDAFRRIGVGHNIVVFVQPNTAYIIKNGVNVLNYTAPAGTTLFGANVYNSSVVVIVGTRYAYNNHHGYRIIVINLDTNQQFDVTAQNPIGPYSYASFIFGAYKPYSSIFYVCYAFAYLDTITIDVMRFNVESLSVSSIHTAYWSGTVWTLETVPYSMLYVSPDESEFYMVFGPHFYYKTRTTSGGRSNGPIIQGTSNTNDMLPFGIMKINPQYYENKFVFQVNIIGESKISTEPTVRKGAYLYVFKPVDGQIQFLDTLISFQGVFYYGGYSINATHVQLFYHPVGSVPRVYSRLFEELSGTYIPRSDVFEVSVVEGTADLPCLIFYHKTLFQIEAYSSSSGRIFYRYGEEKLPYPIITAPPTTTTTTFATPTTTYYTETTPFATPEAHSEFILNAIIPLTIIFIPAGLMFYLMGGIGAVVGLLIGIAVGYSAGFIPFSLIIVMVLAVAVLFIGVIYGRGERRE